MSKVEDVENQLSIYANKTGSANMKVIQGAVTMSIASINRSLSNYVIAGRDVTTSVSASATTVTLPSRCRRVKELGRYDSSGDRMKPAYEEISEGEFNARYGRVTSLSSIPVSHINEWFFVDDDSAGDHVIRLVFPPAASFTMMVTFYEKLTRENADLLEVEDLIYNGAVIRMASWFKNDIGVAYREYTKAINQMRAIRRSSKRTLRQHVHPRIAAHNATAAGLVT